MHISKVSTSGTIAPGKHMSVLHSLICFQSIILAKPIPVQKDWPCAAYSWTVAIRGLLVSAIASWRRSTNVEATCREQYRHSKLWFARTAKTKSGTSFSSPNLVLQNSANDSNRMVIQRQTKELLRRRSIGTSIEKTDANTGAVFGDYISIYDIQRAVADKATVPIDYEGRI